MQHTDKRLTNMEMKEGRILIKCEQMLIGTV